MKLAVLMLREVAQSSVDYVNRQGGHMSTVSTVRCLHHLSSDDCSRPQSLWSGRNIKKHMPSKIRLNMT